MEMGPRTALIIGASSEGGLGEACARRLAGDGCAIIVAGRRMAPLETLAGDLEGRAIQCDLADESSIEAMMADAGPIDVLVNAAGTTLSQSITKIRREQIEAQFGVHVTANLLLLKHAAPRMPQGGSIILFSSLTGTVPGVGLAAYASAKAALDQVVRIAALEFGPLGIRVNAVAPGFSRTPMTESFLGLNGFDTLYRRESALGALATPEQVAAAVSYLAAPDCFASGDILQVSGGAQLCRLPRADELKTASGR